MARPKETYNKKEKEKQNSRKEKKKKRVKKNVNPVQVVLSKKCLPIQMSLAI